MSLIQMPASRSASAIMMNIIIIALFTLLSHLGMITVVDFISRGAEAVNGVIKVEHVVTPIMTIGYNGHGM